MNSVAFTSVGYLDATPDSRSSGLQVWRCDRCGCLIFTDDMDLHRRVHEE